MSFTLTYLITKTERKVLEEKCVVLQATQKSFDDLFEQYDVQLSEIKEDASRGSSGNYFLSFHSG